MKPDLKLPWTTEFIVENIILDAAKEGIATLDDDGIAAEVVRRVNAHDALVAALEKVATHCDRYELRCGTCEFVDTAIAAAKGTS